MRVGVDIDGVVYPWVDNLRTWIAMHHPVDRASMPEPTVWDFWTEWGMTREAFDSHCRDAHATGWLLQAGHPFPGAVYAAWKLIEAGHSLHLVTARGIPGSRESTLRWLAAQRFPYDTLTLTRDKTEVPADVYVDDALANYDALDAAGFNPYLVTRAYNQRPGCVRRRVPSFAAFVDTVLAVPQEVAA